jgi:hypothetical protein
MSGASPLDGIRGEALRLVDEVVRSDGRPAPASASAAQLTRLEQALLLPWSDA